MHSSVVSELLTSDSADPIESSSLYRFEVVALVGGRDDLEVFHLDTVRKGREYRAQEDTIGFRICRALP